MSVRYAIRAFRRAPGFTIAAVLSLAIGIGANTAIFSVASALLLDPLPYPDADRLMILWNRSPGLGITEDWFSTAQYVDVSRGHHGFDAVAIAVGANANLTGDGTPERVGAIRMSSNLLPMLGARPALGRLLTSADDRPGATASAILGHGLWQRRYGSDPSVLGRTVMVNGQPYVVAGVLPASFSLPREVMPTLGGVPDADLVLPLPLAENAASIRSHEDYNIVARLAPGVSVAAAQGEMNALTARLRRDHPDIYPPNGGLTFSIVPLTDQVVGGVRRPVLVLFAAVVIVLCVACANVANLLLARAAARRKEFAVRSALGAPARRIVRQLLVEHLALAGAGGALGLAFAAWGLAGLRDLGAGEVPRLRGVSIDGRVLAFTFAVSAAAGLVFGLAPMARLLRQDVPSDLGDAVRGGSGTGSIWHRRSRLRPALVAGEVALALVLVAGAGLLVRSFANVLRVPPGFDAARVLTLEMTLTGGKYTGPARVGDAYRELRDRARRLPGVERAALVSALPLSRMFAWGPISIEGRQPAPGEKFINADQRMITPGYFATMGIPVVDGRDFDDHDARGAAGVAIVDERLAREMWPGASAVGKRLRLGGGADATTPWLTVVGVAGAVKQDALDADSRIAVYLAHPQFPARAMTMVVRTTGAPDAMAGALRQAIRNFDPDLPIYNVGSMDDRVSDSVVRRRFSTFLLALFAAVALVLAAIGVYGVTAYLISQGTRDMGIRLALGASPRDLVLMILRHGAVVAGGGILAGLAVALAVAPLLRTLLFGVDAFDTATFAGVAALLAAIVLTACAIPARRAARIDPLTSLRAE